MAFGQIGAMMFDSWGVAPGYGERRPSAESWRGAVHLCRHRQLLQAAEATGFGDADNSAVIRTFTGLR